MIDIICSMIIAFVIMGITAFMCFLGMDDDNEE